MQDILDPVLLRALQQGTPEALMSIVRKETDTGLFTFPFFTKEFCCKLVHEVHHFEASGLPSTRYVSIFSVAIAGNDDVIT